MFVCVYAWIRVCINMRIHRHDSFICDIHTWHHQFVRGMTLSNVTWLIRSWLDSSILKRLICIWRDSMRHDSFVRNATHPWLIWLTLSHVTCLIHVPDSHAMRLIHTWHDVFTRDTTHPHIWPVTRPYTHAHTHTHTHAKTHTQTHARTHIYTHNTHTRKTHLWHICLSLPRCVCVCACVYVVRASVHVV